MVEKQMIFIPPYLMYFAMAKYPKMQTLFCAKRRKSVIDPQNAPCERFLY